MLSTQAEGRQIASGTSLGADGKAVIHIDKLRAGTNIEVVGEARTIASGRGEFSDDFASLGEHVYKLKP